MSVILEDYFNQDAAQDMYAHAAVKSLKKGSGVSFGQTPASIDIL